MPRLVRYAAILMLAFLPGAAPLAAEQVQAKAAKAAEASAPRLTRELVGGLALRNLGPAFMSGRISDVVKDPQRPSTWYVAVASGGVWKTTNAGTTWTPIFDRQGSYSIGILALDPKNPQVVWVGTGEANATRSVSFGDGVYRSADGGATWSHMGLARSEHIAKILVDPRNSDVVLVASQGPLWSSGGDRGLYKTTDGGKTWKAILQVSEDTGISDVIMDPRNPDLLYAASYQRRRHAGLLVGGGPESAVFKSTDGGATWKKIMRGLPEVDRGRIGLALSPQNPDVVYAIAAAARKQSGFFRSQDQGESWVRQSDYIVVDPQYYMRLFPDPHKEGRVYAVDVDLHVTEDSGKTFRAVNEDNKHGDNHVVAFDARDPEYLLVGGDGGLYESWDRGGSWKFISNLPVTQFYRVGIDATEPFYQVYGGTQDNGTQAGPSRTRNRHGIRNADWRNVVSGDGWQVRVDPTNPDLLYGLTQYGELRRVDRRSGEVTDIRPTEGKGEPRYRFLWDAPHLISPHAHTRIYFGGNRLFRSEDRGDSWKPVSPDLSRGLDRDRLDVMGRVWPQDAVWKNVFTNDFGVATALSESPRKEGLFYAGTDDGLIHVAEDGFDRWRRVDGIPGIPKLASVADLTASLHDTDTLYALFNNHLRGDFTPYVLRSRDRGRTWSSVAGDLPRRLPVWSLVEDHINPDLLFLGTEFGLYVTVDGGKHWVPFTAGVPTIAFRDLEIHRGMSDLVGASFGRGMFVLDDYSSLRHLTPDTLTKEGALFSVRRAWSYIPEETLIFGPKGTLGDNEYVAPNPPFGAPITYYLKEGFREPGASVVITITDAEGRAVRRIPAPAQAGLHRLTWDLRHASPAGEETRGAGPLAVPGRYTARLIKRVGSVETPLGSPQSFEIVPALNPSLPGPDRKEVLALEQREARLQSAVTGTARFLEERRKVLAALSLKFQDAKGHQDQVERVRALDGRLRELQARLIGAEKPHEYAEPSAPSVVDRIRRVTRAQRNSTAAPTQTRRKDFQIASEEFTDILGALRGIVERDLPALEKAAAAAGIPWTPGQPLPDWRPGS